MKRILALLMVAAVALTCIFAEGQKEVVYPSEPIQVICPWSAGGGTDRTIRYIAEQLSKELGQPVNVVNKTGGNGSVGHQAGADAKPDGYTITNVTFDICALDHLGYSKLTPMAYRGIIQFNEDAAAVTVSADSEYNTLKELFDAIKSSPANTFSFSGSAIGSAWDLSRIALFDAAGVSPKKVKYIPSKGAAPAITELLGNHVDVLTCSYPEVAPQVEGGILKTLAVLSDERNPQFEEIPTAKESGIDCSYGTWRGLAVPKETPDAVVDTLVAAMEKIVNSQDFVDFMNSNGFGIKIRVGDEFDSFMKSQYEGLSEIIELAGYAK
jgi:tripartite-type tricarboxylate transporter receptor subunit TctC